MLQKFSRRLAILSIIAVTIVYSINWFNVNALYYLIGPDLGTGVSGLGILTSAFFLGVGSMQIPGGVLSAKYGPKKILLLGLVISSIGAFGESASTLLSEVAVFRFMNAGGLAFIFAPSIAIITRLLKKSGSGTGVGLIQSSFGMGGILGLFAWTLLASITGWRPSIALGGFLLLATGLAIIVFIPRDEPGPGLSVNNLAKVLREKNLYLLGIGVLTSNMGSILVYGFMGYYLESLGRPPALSGFIASLIVVVPILSAIWGGRLFDKSRNTKRLMLSSGLGMSACLALCAAPSLTGVVAGVLLGGLMFGVGPTAAIATAREQNPLGNAYDSFAVACMNATSLIGSFWPSIVFSQLALMFGYSSAWLGSAALSIPLLIPILFLRQEKKDSSDLL